MKIDPYLLPGVPCLVWDKEDFKRLGYFYTTSNCINYFECVEAGKKIFLPYSFYHPINTEWDYAPPEAECSTVDQDGGIRFWQLADDIAPEKGEWIDRDCGYPGYQDKSEFICPDKFRYEKDAWKTSRRTRPEWASDK